MSTCKVECQEWGLDFLRLALAVDLEKKELPVLAASSSTPSLSSPLLVTILVSVSAKGLPSLPFPSTLAKFRENISISMIPDVSLPIRPRESSQPCLFACFPPQQAQGPSNLLQTRKGVWWRSRWKRQSHVEQLEGLRVNIEVAQQQKPTPAPIKS